MDAEKEFERSNGQQVAAIRRRMSEISSKGIIYFSDVLQIIFDHIYSNDHYPFATANGILGYYNHVYCTLIENVLISVTNSPYIRIVNSSVRNTPLNPSHTFSQLLRERNNKAATTTQ